MKRGAERGSEESSRQVELVLPGRMDFEPVAIQSAGAVAAQAGLSSERIEDVKTAVGEAFINAVEHGNRGREDRPVTLCFTLVSDGLRVEVADDGSGFDLERASVPHLREKIEGRESPRGWGLFLMSRLADDLEVSRRAPSGCCLRLTVYSERSPGNG